MGETFIFQLNIKVWNSSVLPESREEGLYPLRRHGVRTEDESHGEENSSGGRLVQEPAERLRQGRRSRLDLQAADIDKGGRQRTRVVQHVVRVDEDAGQVPCIEWNRIE